MSNIDLSGLITPEAKNKEAEEKRELEIKAECANIITSVINERTQASLLAAMVADSLSANEKAIFKSGQKWIEATKNASRKSIKSGKKAVWPKIPSGLEDLASKY